jgi:hypothetical protein
MKPFHALTAVCLTMALSACALFESKEAAALREAQGQASHEEIRRQWGEPTTVRSLDSGESIWIYQKRDQQPGNRMTAPGTWCDEYALTFDEQGILRSWTHRSVFHGGDAMPGECIP